jgi:hypothetical protein
MVKIPREGTDGSRYAVLMPGALPGGLHISLHGTGNTHLRATTPRGVVTLDLLEVARRVARVGPGPVIRLLVRPPTRGHRATGVIVPGPATEPIRTPGHVDFDAGRIIDAMVGFEVEDNAEVVAVLKELRRKGDLHDGDMVQISVPDIDETSFYRPFSGEMVSIPDDMPFADDFRALQSQIAEAGGIFQTVGGPDDMFATMRDIPGFDLIMAFVKAIGEGFDDPGLEAKLMGQVLPFLGGIEPAVESAARRGVFPAAGREKEDPK